MEQKISAEKIESGDKEKNLINLGENGNVQKKAIEYFSNLRPGQKLETKNGLSVKFSRYWKGEDENRNKIDFIYGFIGKKDYWWHKDGTPKFFNDTDLTLVIPKEKK